MGLRSELPDRWYEVRIIVERSPGSASQLWKFETMTNDDPNRMVGNVLIWS